MAASHSSRTTTSTYSADTTHGTHLFRITEYSLYNGTGVGECIESATFAVGGYDWRVCLYPDGNTEKYKDWVSAFLDLKTGDAEVRAFFDLRLVNQATKQALRPFTWPPDPSGITLFDSDGASWGNLRLRACSVNPHHKRIGKDWRGLRSNLTYTGFNPSQSISIPFKSVATEQGGSSDPESSTSPASDLPGPRSSSTAPREHVAGVHPLRVETHTTPPPDPLSAPSRFAAAGGDASEAARAPGMAAAGPLASAFGL
ncbi:BTB/POZ and MATH domain-containing protein 2 [Hordeum vulgare]|nr:BTB/POZ and MATH domain-containing protein 2 [Hordeum vulgare]